MASFTAAPSPTITSKDAVAQIVNMAAVRSLRRIGALRATTSTTATASTIARMTNARAIVSKRWSTRWSANVNHLIRRDNDDELRAFHCLRCPDGGAIGTIIAKNRE